MKLMFNKTEYFGQWFEDDEYPETFTDKVPQNTGYLFDDELNDWVPKPEPEVTEEPTEQE
jgi:hypothetical protein